MKSSRSPMEKFEVLIVKKFHWILGIAMTVVTPTISVTAAYYSGKADIDNKIQAVRQDTVPKQDFDRVLDKIEALTKEVSRMSGAMEQMNRQDRQNRH